MHRTRILLADDHAIVRSGLKSLIDLEKDLEVVGEAADGAETIRLVRDLHPDVVVLDITLPDMNGTQVLTQLPRAAPGGQGAHAHAPRGAGLSPADLRGRCEGVRAEACRREGSHLGDPHCVRRRNLLRPPAGPVHDGGAGGGLPDVSEPLSLRETEVLRFIAQGYSNKEIGAKLRLSVKTIETYKSRSMEKLGIRSRVEIVRHAFSRGWLNEA